METTISNGSLERYRRLTAQYPSFVGWTYLPVALFFVGFAFVNPHASGPLLFFGFWAVVFPLLVVMHVAIVRWYGRRFGRVRPKPEQRRRNRWLMVGLVVAIVALDLGPWDERLGVEIVHLAWALVFIVVWWSGEFGRERLHFPLGALVLFILAFLDHSRFVVGSWDLVPDTAEGVGLVDAVVLAAVGFLDHLWLVRSMEAR